MPLLCGAVVHLFRGIFLLRRKIFVPLVIIDRGPGLVSCCPWVHIAIANAKLLLLDVYHDIRPEYLQNYLNEFCWKFNRRNFGEALFDRLMVDAVSYKINLGITLSNHIVLNPSMGKYRQEGPKFYSTKALFL